jgi:class 3 adenylate cyclase
MGDDELHRLRRQAEVVAKFPDQNPHPVLRIGPDGVLLYANPAAEPVRRALGIEVGEALPAALAERLESSARAADVDLHIRVGMHLGPAVTGVVGVKKFIYDVWGETVNTASRMESHGVADRIQVSEAAFERLRDRYRLEARGMVDIRGRGPMPTWFLEPQTPAG